MSGKHAKTFKAIKGTSLRTVGKHNNLLVKASDLIVGE